MYFLSAEQQSAAVGHWIYDSPEKDTLAYGSALCKLRSDLGLNLYHPRTSQSVDRSKTLW
jgi:hypothetical protein